MRLEFEISNVVVQLLFVLEITKYEKGEIKNQTLSRVKEKEKTKKGLK